jgi:hypothetical protein
METPSLPSLPQEDDPDYYSVLPLVIGTCMAVESVSTFNHFCFCTYTKGAQGAAFRSTAWATV